MNQRAVVCNSNIQVLKNQIRAAEKIVAGNYEYIDEATASFHAETFEDFETVSQFNYRILSSLTSNLNAYDLFKRLSSDVFTVMDAMEVELQAYNKRVAAHHSESGAPIHKSQNAMSWMKAFKDGKIEGLIKRTEECETMIKSALKYTNELLKKLESDTKD